MALAMVVRNDQGKLLYMASKLTSGPSAFSAEVKAPVWASAFAKEANWRNVIWSSDAKEVVHDVTMKEEPCG